MGKFIAISLFLLVWLFGQVAQATTISQGRVPDPFAEGEECEAPEIMSTGSYVYQWPSKYDFVFEPWVDLIWYCEVSGYVSYPKDFDKLSMADVTAIGGFLSDRDFHLPKGEAGLQYVLDRMEALYALRVISLEDRAYFMRARAWLYQDNPHADAYRRLALDIHETILDEQDPQGWDLIVNHYVAGFYNWKLGDPETAVEHFKKASSVEWVDEDGAQSTGSDYVNSLIDEIRAGKAEDGTRFSKEGN